MSQRPKAETVYAVECYYDGPIAGLSAFRGRPHRFDFEREWERRGAIFREYRLTPAGDGLLALVLAKHRLWSRWQAMNRKGTLPTDLKYEERVLPDDLAEYRVLEARIADCTSREGGDFMLAMGRFFVGRRRTVHGACCEQLRVVWSSIRKSSKP